MKDSLSIVISALNEEENIPLLYNELLPVLDELPLQSVEVILVDDGSTDNTLERMQSVQQKDERFKVVRLTRNFGHEAAMTAGMNYATGDGVVFMDADLQHPPRLIPQLIEHWQNGFDVVYTQRYETRKTPFFKRITSNLFYKFFAFLSGLSLPAGTADFRLLDRKVVNEVAQMRERSLFLRGMIFWMGFKQIAVPYRVEPRFAGQSHYTLRKMLSLAFVGATSFSTKPLRLAVYLGLLVTFFGFLFICYVLYMRLFGGDAITGWASVLSVMLILGGTQLFMMGIIGEYLGLIFMETKNRPAYFISESSLEKKNECN